MPQLGAQLLCRAGCSDGTSPPQALCLLSGLKLWLWTMLCPTLCCVPSVTHAALPAAFFKSLTCFGGKKMTFSGSPKTPLCPLWAWRAECWKERTGSEGLSSERWGCRGCSAHAGTGEDKPSSPPLPPHAYACERDSIC